MCQRCGTISGSSSIQGGSLSKGTLFRLSINLVFRHIFTFPSYPPERGVHGLQLFYWDQNHSMITQRTRVEKVEQPENPSVEFPCISIGADSQILDNGECFN